MNASYNYGLKYLLLVGIIIQMLGCNNSVEPKIEFKSSPLWTVDHNRPYAYKIEAKKDEQGNELSIKALQLPSWLSLDHDNNTLHGLAGWENLNLTFTVRLHATQGDKEEDINYSLSVLLGEIDCDAEFGNPADSEYILPYHEGESYRMWQSYCHPQWSHKNWFSYDFDMPMGTEILASRAGTVIFERDNFEDDTNESGNENFIFIEHADGTVVHYVHLMQGGSLVEVGQVVEQGELIGLSGNSGGSAGPHLHTSQFIGRTNFDRQYSIPMNYRNAKGPVNANHGLIIEEMYEAMSYE